MPVDKKNAIYKLCKKFALRIIRFCVFLRDSRHEQIMSRQISRSGTSIGANVAESVFAQSEADYINKLKIALKEAGETRYWLELPHEAGFITAKAYGSLLNVVKTIIGSLINIINKLKDKCDKK